MKPAGAASVSILLLAAGFGRRMKGADKLLMEVDGEPLLRRQAIAARGVCDDVIVTLPAEADARRAALAGLAVRTVPVDDAAEGMAASIRAGVAALPADARGVMILPGDMPELGPAEIEALLHAAGPDVPAVIRGAAEDGTPGHPVLFPRRHFAALRGLSGDRGAHPVLASAEEVRLVRLRGHAALIDLDTPDAWAEWRARKSRGDP